MSEAQILELTERIASLHEVEDVDTFATTILPQHKIRERVRELIMQDYDAESLTDEGRLMVRMGLLSPGTCYEETIYSVLTDQVVGLYDPRHDELLLVPGFPEVMTHEVLVHEITHAVQDSGFDIGQRLARVPGQMDRRAGLQAVTEGDALLMEQIFSGILVPASITAEQILALMQMTSQAGDPFLKAPSFIRETLLFPYVYGLVLVRQAYEQGGYEAVNELLEHPPVSTEQVLHPERMGVDPPLKVEPVVSEDLALLYREAGRDVMGEFTLRSWLARYMDAAQAAQAARGWGGDGYVLLWPRTSDVGPEHLHHGVLLLVTEWDEGPAGSEALEARQFEKSLLTYATARYPDARIEADAQRTILDIGADQRIVIERRDRQVVFIEGLPASGHASVEALMESLWSSYTP